MAHNQTVPISGTERTEIRPPEVYNNGQNSGEDIAMTDTGPSTQSSQPAQPAQSSQPAQPAQSSQPAQPAQPAHPAQPGASHPLPDPRLPFANQILEQVKEWAEIGARIENEQGRKEMLDRAFETLTNVWYEALRVGYETGYSTPAVAVRTTTTSAPSKTRRDQGPERPPSKPRLTDPSKAPVIISKNHKQGLQWAVTAGELEEFGISEEHLRQRASSGQLQKGLDYLTWFRQHMGRDLQHSDWWGRLEPTKNNPSGRCLWLYCFYEVQRSQDALAHLRNLYSRFSSSKQKENTQNRIDEEQERHNLFLALAMEVMYMPPGGLHAEKFDPNSEAGRSVDVPSVTHGGTTLSGVQVSATENNTVQNPEPKGKGRADESESEMATGPEKNTEPGLGSLGIDVATSEDEKPKDALPAEDIDAMEVDQPSTDKHKTEHDNHMTGEAVESEDSVKLSDTKGDQDLKIHILPKVNEMFTNVGLEPATSTSLPNLQDAIKGAEAPMEDRNALTREINMNYEQARGSEEQKAATVTPPAGPTVGIDPPYAEETEETMTEPMTTVSTEPKDQSLVIKLPVGASFNPTDLSSETVFSHKGFSYRYTRQSTLAQRRSMDEVLDAYVRDRTKTLHKNPRYQFLPEPRFGKYEVLTHPDDQERTSIIHGFWDLKDGSKVPNAEWFYEGNGEMPRGETFSVYGGDEGNITSSAAMSATSKPAGSQTTVPDDERAKNVIRLKRDRTNWTVDSSNNAEVQDKPKRKAAALSQSTTSAESAEKQKRRKTRRRPANNDDEDEYRPSS